MYINFKHFFIIKQISSKSSSMETNVGQDKKIQNELVIHINAPLHPLIANDKLINTLENKGAYHPGGYCWN